MSRAVLEELVTVLGFEVDDATLNRASQAVDQYERRARATTSANDTLGKSMRFAVAAWVALEGTIASGSALIDANAEAERYAAQLETLTGSQIASAEAWAMLEQFAATTPFALEQSIQAFARLKSMGLDPGEEALRSYGDTAAAMGMDFMQMVEAVADATTGEYERLKEFGIRAESAGNQVTFTFQGVSTTVRKNAEEVEAYLKSIGQTTFSGAMGRQMETLTGKMSNLGDAHQRFLRQVGLAGFNDGLRDLLGVLAETISEGDDVAFVLGEILGGSLERTGDGIEWATENAHALGAALALVGGTVVMSKVLAIAAAIRATGTAALVAQGKALLIPAALASTGLVIGLLLDDINGFMNGHESMVGKLIEKYPELEEPLRAIGVVIQDVFEHGLDAGMLMLSDLVSAFGELWDVVEFVTAAVADLGVAIVALDLPPWIESILLRLLENPANLIPGVAAMGVLETALQPALNHVLPGEWVVNAQGDNVAIPRYSGEAAHASVHSPGSGDQITIQTTITEREGATPAETGHAFGTSAAEALENRRTIRRAGFFARRGNQ